MREDKADKLTQAYRKRGLEAFYRVCKARKLPIAHVPNASREYFALGYTTALIEFKQQELIKSRWRRFRVWCAKLITKFFTGG